MRGRAAGGVILLLDENLSGRRIIDGLTENGIPVRAQTSIMKRGISDEEVLAALTQYPDYFLLTKDADFHKKPVVKEAMVRHGIGVFVITAHKDKTAVQLVELIGTSWRRIERFAKKHDRPFVAKILANGRVEKA